MHSHSDWKKDAAELFLRAKAGETPATRAFLSAAHKMTAEHEAEKAAAKAMNVRLLRSLMNQTQSKAEHADCAKMLAVLS